MRGKTGGMSFEAWHEVPRSTRAAAAEQRRCMIEYLNQMHKAQSFGDSDIYKCGVRFKASL